MAGPPRVRVAGHEDVADLARLIAAFRDFLGAPAPANDAIEPAVRALLDDPGTELALARTDPAGPAVGYTQLRVLPSVWTVGREAWLEDIFVEHAARGGGAGAALLEHALARAHALGATAIALSTNERNERARRLYLAHGFRPAGEARWGAGREIRFVRGLGDG